MFSLFFAFLMGFLVCLGVAGEGCVGFCFLTFLFLGAGDGSINGGVHSPATNLSSIFSISVLVPVKLF